jgi:hypothetical protein
MFRLPVTWVALGIGALGVVLLIAGLAGGASRCFVTFGVALIASCIVALISASSARTGRPHPDRRPEIPQEVQPGVVLEGMSWWALVLIAIFLLLAAVFCGVIG